MRDSQPSNRARDGLLPRPQLPVQGPVVDRLHDMLGPDDRCSFKVGDGARDLDRPIEPARGDPDPPAPGSRSRHPPLPPENPGYRRRRRPRARFATPRRRSGWPRDRAGPGRGGHRCGSPRPMRRAGRAMRGRADHRPSILVTATGILVGMGPRKSPGRVVGAGRSVAVPSPSRPLLL